MYGLHGTITMKMAAFITTAVRSSNLTIEYQINKECTNTEIDII
jgi:hypothetical protein